MVFNNCENTTNWVRLILKKMSSDTKGFLKWTLVLFVWFLFLMSVWSKMGGGDKWDYFYSNCVFFGFVFNFCLAVLSHFTPDSFLTRPRLKLFPEKFHHFITWLLLFAFNISIMFLPQDLYQFMDYMLKEHADIVALISRFFG